MKSNKEIMDMYILQRVWDPNNTLTAPIAMLAAGQMQAIYAAIQSAIATMTPLERTVLQGKIDGCSNAAIADRLDFDAAYISKIYNAAVSKVAFPKGAY